MRSSDQEIQELRHQLQIACTKNKELQSQGYLASTTA